jgi:hypothetical protein
MIKACNLNANIPSADTIQRNIIEIFKNCQLIVRQELQVNKF